MLQSQKEGTINKVEIIITPDEHGNLNVNGPLENKIACYGMLEMAKDLFRRYVPPPQNDLRYTVCCQEPYRYWSN